MRAPSGYSKRNHIIPKYLYCRIAPRKTCRPCGFTMKISPMGHGHLIYIVKKEILNRRYGSLPAIYSVAILVLRHSPVQGLPTLRILFSFK